MDYDKLVEEYKKLPQICEQTDYSDKKSVRANNKAVKRMYEIVGLISNSDSAKFEFSKLLDIKDYKIDLWAATHMIEKLNPDLTTKQKALSIIKEVAKGEDSLAFGYQMWLKENL
jgi:hypothetical protein